MAWRRGRVYASAAMAEFSLPRDDEPVDFRRQAGSYARYRRDYSDALYDAITARTGTPARRIALDVGCGTGFVTANLAARGWRVVGVDFSAPMLQAARDAGHRALPFLQARADALPVRNRGAALITCGTSFHWFPPLPTLTEFARAVAPGGWVALFWRYPVAGQAHTALMAECLQRVDVVIPDGFVHLRVHSPHPFAGGAMVPEPEITIPTTLRFTAAEWHGHVGTLEWIRRLANTRHAELLERLGEEIARRFPDGVEERNEELLYLARVS